MTEVAVVEARNNIKDLQKFISDVQWTFEKVDFLTDNVKRMCSKNSGAYCAINNNICLPFTANCDFEYRDPDFREVEEK